MLYGRRPWREELAIVDRIMRAISDVSDPNEMVDRYWDGVRELLPSDGYLALSRRGVEAPEYLVTRSSRFDEHVNPWTQRDKLPRLSGGLLGEIAYADEPLVIDDIGSRLAADDPGRRYVEGFESLIALPSYEGGKGVNVGITLFLPGSDFDRSAVPMMHWQAGLFGRGTHGLVLRNQLAAALAELDRELKVVGDIQRSLLPQALPALPGFDVAASYETSARAGGDYYDFFDVGDGGWGVFIADVSGHGTPAAVLMAVTHALAHSRPGAPTPPGQLLVHLNDHLARSYTASGSFVTAFYATLDVNTRRMVYSAAGHNPPRLIRGGRAVSLGERGGLPLGVFEGERYEEASVGLEPGDLVMLYTDGITEAMAPAPAGGGHELFGVSRLDELLGSCGGATAAECVERVRGAVATFTRNAPATDDRTLVALRCL